MKDLTIYFNYKTGSLADVGKELGKAGINIEGLCGLVIEEKWLEHILVKDAISTRKVLLKSNFDVGNEKEVIVFSKSEKKS